NVLQTTGLPGCSAGLTMAPARLSKVWTTSFGAPVVPDVSKIHSVLWRELPLITRGTMVRLQGLKMSGRFPPKLCIALSETITSTAAVSITYGRCSSEMSGGHTTIRRARPSSSINADAAINWLLVATSTHRPLSSTPRSKSAEPNTKSLWVIVVSGPARKKSGAPLPVESAWRRDAHLLRLLCRFFIQLHKIAKGHWEQRIFRDTKRIHSDCVLKPGDDNCERKRIETRLKKFQIIS